MTDNVKTSDVDLIEENFEKNDDEVPFFEDDTSDVSDNTSKSQSSKKQNSLSSALNSVIDDVTLDYIEELDKNNLPHPYEIEKELISRVNSAITLENLQVRSIPAGKDKNGNKKYVKERDRWTTITRLVPFQIVRLITAFHNILRIDATENDVEAEEDLLGIYIDDPDHTNYGLYDVNESSLFKLVQLYDRQIGKAKFKDVQFILQAMAERKPRSCQRDLIAVNNGIFNYKTKKLEPFTPRKVFLAKSKVDYIPNPVNPVIFNNEDNTTWDIESWMETLSDDKEIVQLLWRTLSCIVRPFVRWNKAVWLYSTVGNNGKGTLCLLMRNLCGAGSHASIPLADFDKEFALQPLIHANAVIVDENNVGEFIDKSANLKAVITNDVISINRKFLRSIDFRFWGFMVQCINELPRVKDKSDSFYRRQILIPMEKCFTGVECEYIKDDYLNRKDVLEYALWRVLNVDTFYKLESPDKCLDLLNNYKNSNDPVRDFLLEFQDRFIWNLVPMDFLYDLYGAWYKRFNSTGKPEGRTKFKAQIEQLISQDPTSSWAITPNAVKTAGKTSNPEPLIMEYNLIQWKNSKYIGKDVNQICMPLMQERTRGIIRRTIATANVSANSNVNAEASIAANANTAVMTANGSQ